MSEEKKPSVWRIWTDKSVRTQWQQGYVEAFPIGLIVGLQLGASLMMLIDYWVRH